LAGRDRQTCSAEIFPDNWRDWAALKISTESHALRCRPIPSATATALYVLSFEDCQLFERWGVSDRPAV
jgi:hypothetical protein